MATSLRHALSSIISILLLANCALPSPSAADGAAATLGSYPPMCERIECPSFDVIDKGNGYEIRRYNSPVWMSTSSIEDISFVNATRIGFLQGVDGLTPGVLDDDVSNLQAEVQNLTLPYRSAA